MTEIKVGKTESLDSALRRFKRATQKAGVLSEVRKREHYEKPSVRRKKSLKLPENVNPDNHFMIWGFKVSLREILQTDMKHAMKDRENGKLQLTVLRMVWAAIRNKEIDEKTELKDDAVMAVIMKEIKERRYHPRNQGCQSS